MRAVRFEQYGGPEVLHVVDVRTPRPGIGEVVVRVVTAGTNPGEAQIRSGALKKRWPARFPEGQGSDLAGVVAAVGAGVEALAVGDPVIGFSDARNAQAEYATLPWQRLVPKPDALRWDVAGTLYVAGTTAVALMQAVESRPEETILVSGAAGGVGVFVTQLALRENVRVVAVASKTNHPVLRTWGATPVAYGDGLADRVRDVAPEGVHGLIDTHGGGYLDFGRSLGIPAERMATLIDRVRAQQLGSVATGMATVRDPAAVVSMLADAVVHGEVHVPMKARFPLSEVRQAYRELERRSGLGKVVLEVQPP